MLTAAALALVASVVAALAVKPGPLLAGGSRPQLRHVFDGFRRPLPRLANLGYFGHMWELYALWTWLPTFVLASQAAHAGRETLGSVRDVGLTSFAAIGLAGVVGCLLGGWPRTGSGGPPRPVRLWRSVVCAVCSRPWPSGAHRLCCWCSSACGALR